MNFKNKVVWITGASSGIGEAMAYEFANQGARLVLSARRLEELERVRNSCYNPDAHLSLPFDLLHAEKEAESHLQKVLSAFGRIDVVVNNGGVSQRATAEETSMELTRMIMEVNFFASVAITKAVLPQMKKQHGGHIVVMSSIAGKFGFYLRSAYSAAKHALHGYFESLRLEVEKDNIRVTIVCPGKIKTNVSLNALTGTGDRHSQMDSSHETGMDPLACARVIIQAVSEEKEEVLVGGKEIKAVTVKRFFPSLFKKIIRKQKPL